MNHFRLLFLLFSGLAACDQVAKRADVLYTQDDTVVEVARDVEILYSDSAIVRVRVTAPTLHNHTEREDPRQEFPDGIKIEFLTPNLTVRSTLTSKFAARRQDKGLVVGRDSVERTTI